jgi:hypothetical protein
MVAGSRVKHARRVAQLGARREVGVVPDADAFDQAAQGARRLVALEARKDCCRHSEYEEPGAKQRGSELDRLLRVCLGGDQVSAAHADARSER